jgi:hypothetical protein
MHNRTTRDLQIRLNSLDFLSEYKKPLLAVDGMNGPNTQYAVKCALEYFDADQVEDLFHPSGINRVHWHWMASGYAVSKTSLAHYNDGVDHMGNVYDGGALAQLQAEYSYRNRIGVSHTFMANTGSIGIGIACMAGASCSGSTVDAGKFPITWEGIDGMLKRTAEYCKLYDIKPSPWTTLTHAEVGPNIGIKQRGKWDIRVLPDDLSKLLPAKQAGDILRERLKDFL